MPSVKLIRRWMSEKFGRRDVDKDANYWRYKKILRQVKRARCGGR